MYSFSNQLNKNKMFFPICSLISLSLQNQSKHTVCLLEPSTLTSKSHINTHTKKKKYKANLTVDALVFDSENVNMLIS